MCLCFFKRGPRVRVLVFDGGELLTCLGEFLLRGGEGLAPGFEAGNKCPGFFEPPGFGGEVVFPRGEFGLNAQEGFLGVLLLLAQLIDFFPGGLRPYFKRIGLGLAGICAFFGFGELPALSGKLLLLLIAVLADLLETGLVLSLPGGEILQGGGFFVVLFGESLDVRLQLGEPFFLREDGLRHGSGGGVFQIDTGGQRPEGQPVTLPDDLIPDGPVIDEGAGGGTQVAHLNATIRMGDQFGMMPGDAVVIDHHIVVILTTEGDEPGKGHLHLLSVFQNECQLCHEWSVGSCWSRASHADDTL